MSQSPTEARHQIARACAVLAVVGAGAIAHAGTASATSAAGRCTPLDSRSLDIDLQPSGHLKFVYADDDVTTCDEIIVVTSYASGGPEVDHTFDPVVDEVTFFVSELEAAGPAGVTVNPDLDECWAGIEVLRDGDTFLWDHIEGDGCEMEISTDFHGAPFHTEVHVVQQTGAIQPPHILDHEDDTTTLLTGLPNGTWYVKVYEGAQPATTMSLDAAAPQQMALLNGVPDGSSVLIEHPAVFTGAGDLVVATTSVPPSTAPTILVSQS